MSDRLKWNYTVSSVLKFTLPAIIMEVFIAMYQACDGFFIGRYIDPNGIAAISLTNPFVLLFLSLSYMLATGGDVITAKLLGEGKQAQARENFTMFVFLSFVIGLVGIVLQVFFLDDLVSLLGANDAVREYTRDYLSVMLLAAPAIVMQYVFLRGFILAGRPNLGTIATIAGGLVNIGLDANLVGLHHGGIVTAAVTTAIGYAIPVVVGLLYFSLNHRQTLYFTTFRIHWQDFLTGCYCGLSEMVNFCSLAIASFLFNHIVMNLAAEDGVAAYGIIVYAGTLNEAIFTGYSEGVAPLLSYNCGQQDRAASALLISISQKILGALTAVMFAVLLIFRRDIVSIFAAADPAMSALALNGMFFGAFNALFMGTNIFATFLFSSLMKGKEASLISLLRSFVFYLLCMLTLPQAFGISGAWLASPCSEGLGMIATLWLLKKDAAIQTMLADHR